MVTVVLSITLAAGDVTALAKVHKQMKKITKLSDIMKCFTLPHSSSGSKLQL
jgi:hypothetical protein